MPTRIIVNGAQGKMGSLACKTLDSHPDFIIVGALTRKDDLRAAIHQAQAEVVLDLTRADCVYENSLMIIENGASPVIGTSGLLDEQIKILQNLCTEKKVGGIIVPNFSISAVLMMRFAAIAAKFMPEVEIIEAHHQQKLDAPSGTAIKTAEMIAASREQTKQQLLLKELITGARGANYCDINIHSLRLPGFVAQQQVIFGNIGETLNITHNSIDRVSFMPGVILACQQVRKLKSLYYGLENLLEIH